MNSSAKPGRGALLALIACSAGLLALGAPQSERIDRDAQAVESELMSPFCPGRLLVNCPSAEAERLRVQIRARLAGGQPRDAVIAELVERYGERMLAAPAARGLGLLAWILPAALVVGGAALVIAWLVRHRVPAPAADRAVPPAAVGRELEARLDRELRDLS
ncbi:MAG: cytochrome c-type biogenesis protein CcmH [Deltaproteobacteria bacterium]|nr:cytochrome c-type biogenesis protein CcmH [Deltaproteobacteria bacterium]